MDIYTYIYIYIYIYIHIYIHTHTDINLYIYVHVLCSPFVDKDHKYAIGGNLKTIKTNKLCKIFSKRPKYHEIRIPDYQKGKESIITRIKTYIQSLGGNKL